MGLLDRLFGRNEEKKKTVHSSLLNPIMMQFMGRCISAVKKAGIKAHGTDRFSILVGDQKTEVSLDSFWALYETSKSDAVFDVFVELVQRRLGISAEPTVDRLFPYVIPEVYIAHQDSNPAGIIKPLGHDIYVGLVFDLGGLVEGLNADGLSRLRMTPGQAHERALENLQALAKAQEIKMTVYPEGPTGKPFVLVGGHWAAATSILLPNLQELVQGPLGSMEILATIPHRDAMLLFPRGNRKDRDAFRAMVREKESDGLKPLTLELFKIAEDGVKPFKEDF